MYLIPVFFEKLRRKFKSSRHGYLKIDVGRNAFSEETSTFRLVTTNELGNGVSSSDCYVAVSALPLSDRHLLTSLTNVVCPKEETF